jgi:hypothetical protein
MPTRSASTKSSSSVRKVDSSSSAPFSCSVNFASWMSGSLSSVYAGPTSMPPMKMSQRLAERRIVATAAA